MNLTISPAQSQLSCYAEAMRFEISSSSHQDLQDLEQLPINHPEILKYKNKLLGGAQATWDYPGWTRFLTDYGPRRRCLSLGSGHGRVEKFLIQLGFTEGFETIELSPHANEKARKMEQRITTLEGDLNFLQLEPKAYDFILCHGVLHHIINLEHLLDQINRALTPDGILLVYEYIGPTRWQFGDHTLRELRRAFPDVKFRVPRLWDLQGFESVRSGELLELLEAQFSNSRIRTVSYGGVYFPFVTCTKSPRDSHIKRAVALETECHNHDDVFPACYFMGLYRKSTHEASIARPWSDAEVVRRLSPPMPILHGLFRGLMSTPAGPPLRKVKQVLAQFAF